jgi:hypothetical protein
MLARRRGEAAIMSINRVAKDGMSYMGNVLKAKTLDFETKS